MSGEWWRAPGEIERPAPPPVPFDFFDFLKLCWFRIEQLRIAATIDAAMRNAAVPRWVVTPRREWWWLSFCDPGRPDGQQHLGVSIVEMPEAAEMLAVVQVAYALGCNPGGHVLAQVFVEANNSGIRVPEKFVGRLMSKEEAGKLDEWMLATYPDKAMPNQGAFASPPPPRGPTS